MSTNIPPIPIKTPLVDKDGFMNQQWIRWINALLQRAGGVQADSITEIMADIDDHETRITALGG